MPPAKPTTTEMGRKHEDHCAEVFGGRRHKASGSRWDEQADGSNAHDLAFAFRWDGKATLAKSHTITLDMLAKLREQSHGERPALPLCWYSSTSLDFGELWTLVQDDDLAEVLEAARETERLRARVQELEAGSEEGSPATELLTAENQRLQGELDRARSALSSVQAELSGLQSRHDIGLGELRGLRELVNGGGAADIGTGASPYDGSGPGKPEQEYIPDLPWVIISQFDKGSRRVTEVTRYGADGAKTFGLADTVVVERSLGSSNRPRLIVDGLRVPNGSLYLRGKLTTRAWESNPTGEVG